MIPVGYMFKQVCRRPDWLEAKTVRDIFSVSACISEDFCDWIHEWKHNGYWLFDAPDIMESIARKQNISLTEMTLFFYRASEREWDLEHHQWIRYQPEESFRTQVEIPSVSTVEGFDIVSFSTHNACECSPLSCNHLATHIRVNQHCLLESYEEAKALIESGDLIDCEPGPYRIFEVHSVSRG